VNPFDFRVTGFHGQKHSCCAPFARLGNIEFPLPKDETKPLRLTGLLIQRCVCFSESIAEPKSHADTSVRRFGMARQKKKRVAPSNQPLTVNNPIVQGNARASILALVRYPRSLVLMQSSLK
jgi:hypothetical protein